MPALVGLRRSLRLHGAQTATRHFCLCRSRSL